MKLLLKDTGLMPNKLILAQITKDVSYANGYRDGQNQTRDRFAFLNLYDYLTVRPCHCLGWSHLCGCVTPNENCSDCSGQGAVMRVKK